MSYEHGDVSVDSYMFRDRKVRTAGSEDRPLFCAEDVCAILGYSRTRDALRILDQDEVVMVPRTECASSQKELEAYVTEPGLYALVMKSKRPDAKAFQKWVMSEVLPTIRKTGSYGQGDIQKALHDTATLHKLLLENVEKVLALEEEAQTNRPKAEVYDRIIDTGDTVGFREACKLIRAGTGAKEHEVRAFMVKARWIQRLGGRLAPASYGQDQDYVTSRDKEVVMRDGGTIVVPELRITQRGVTQAVKRLNGPKAVA